MAGANRLRKVAQLYVCFGLLACSAAGPAGPGGGGPVSEFSGGNSLDSKPNGPPLAAAQPVAIGQPAPGPDPGQQNFFIQQARVMPDCKVEGKDLVNTKFDGFVR